VARHGGRVVKLIGDVVMFVADDPAKGARAALDLIDELAGDPQMPEVRVGLAAGPVISYQGDYYGEVVNLAARLVKAAEPGAALASESVVEGAPAPLGAQRVQLAALKGFDEPVPTYRLTR
jgi:adenylate cyclase